MGGNSDEAKREVQKAAESAFNASFNVICSTGPFSYVTHTDSFCQVSKGKVTCYAFRV